MPQAGPVLCSKLCLHYRWTSGKWISVNALVPVCESVIVCVSAFVHTCWCELILHLSLCMCWCVHVFPCVGFRACLLLCDGAREIIIVCMLKHKCLFVRAFWGKHVVACMLLCACRYFHYGKCMHVGKLR